VIPHLRIAEAQLRGRPRQSAIALLSVAVGSAMLIVTLSLTTGLSEDFIRKSTETSAHVEVLPRRPQGWKPEALPQPGDAVFSLTRHHIPDEKRTVRPLAGVMSVLTAMAGVRVVTPGVDAQAVLSYGTVRRSVALSGIVPAGEAAITVLDEKMVSGSWTDLEPTPDGVILGSQLARALGVDVGAHLQALGVAGGALPLKVVGIVQSGLATVDRRVALVNLPLAQALAGLPNDQATTVRVGLDDPLGATDFARAAEGRTGYICRSWQERAASQVEAFERQNLITQVLVFFTVLVAAFGVANVLVQLVADKRRDIAILRAAGFARHDIGIIFLHQGILLGLLGSIAGWVAGAALIRVVAALPVDFGEAAVLRNEHLQMADKPWFYGAALAISLAVCALAAVQPARRAAALDPTAILRGEH
jgi:lipoprotein-releasing system permease protein